MDLWGGRFFRPLWFYIMKKIIPILLACCFSASLFGQGFNSKGGSYKGHQSPYTVQQPSSWSGSGISLGARLFATNNHVVDGATNLYIYFPDSKQKYKAETLAVDATNDLAIVKVTDPAFPGFPSARYGFKTDIEDVGVNVFVLGYPLIDTMGEEVKLTTGVVSSRSGFQGDKSQYQISAPVQPGNSGGPLFNEKGELIGIISAKHTGADNVSYGVKLSYLTELASRERIDINFNKSSQIATLPLSEKCKAVIPCTVMVLADNRQSESSASREQQSAYTSTQTYGYPVHCNRPAIERKGDTDVDIYAVEITAEFTAIYMLWTNRVYNPGYYNIDKKTYIVDRSTGKRYTLTRTENCAIAPNQTNIELNSTQEFVLYFPSIPASATSIDLCEPGQTSNWKFYGIRLK